MSGKLVVLPVLLYLVHIGIYVILDINGFFKNVSRPVNDIARIIPGIWIIIFLNRIYRTIRPKADWIDQALEKAVANVNGKTINEK